MVSATEILEEKIDLQEIYQQLSQLAQLIVDETIERLFQYLMDKKEDLFKDKVKKASRYKNGYILRLFLDKLSKMSIKLDETQKCMIEYLKKYI